MTAEERALTRILFHNKVHNSDGQAFESLFTAVMCKKYPDFVQIKPQGQLGDKKNDGYSKSTGTFFQVFAPEDARESESEAVTKTRDSFDGIKSYWDTFCPVQKFFFVLNDKFKGSFPTIERELAEIKSKHVLSECGIFLSKHLEDALFSLRDDEIIAIVGFVPAPEKIQTLDYSIMNQVLAHVMRHKTQLAPTQILSAPDFDEKIRFNGLGKQVAAILATASYHAGLVDEYFSLNSTFAKQEVRNTLNEIYLENAKRNFGVLSSTMTNSDLVFFEILNAVTPGKTEAAQNSALVLMAYFFESCDIFEEPKKEGLKMLLPEKHIKISESILGLGSFILEDLDTPKTIDLIWKDFETVNNTSKFPAYHGFDNLVLALDFLYSIEAIVPLNDGKLKVKDAAD